MLGTLLSTLDGFANEVQKLPHAGDTKVASATRAPENLVTQQMQACCKDQITATQQVWGGLLRSEPGAVSNYCREVGHRVSLVKSKGQDRHSGTCL